MKDKAIVQQIKGKRKICSWVQKGCPTPGWIGRLTIGHKINSIQPNSEVSQELTTEVGGWQLRASSRTPPRMVKNKHVLDLNSVISE
jgi:hypothetical protein